MGGDPKEEKKTMPKYSLVIEVDRLKNLVESLGWKCSSERYQDDFVVVTLLKAIPENNEGYSKAE